MNNETVADYIHRRNLPLVVFDSCAILDIPRLKYGSATLQILDQCSKRGADKYTYLLPDQVVREIDHHLPKILSNSFASINKALSLIVSIESVNDDSLESRIQKKRDMIEDTVRDIVSRSLKMGESDQIIFNAMSRLIAKNDQLTRRNLLTVIVLFSRVFSYARLCCDTMSLTKTSSLLRPIHKTFQVTCRNSSARHIRTLRGSFRV